jgi:hypothetical protein
MVKIGPWNPSHTAWNPSHTALGELEIIMSIIIILNWKFHMKIDDGLIIDVY